MFIADPRGLVWLPVLSFNCSGPPRTTFLISKGKSKKISAQAFFQHSSCIQQHNNFSFSHYGYVLGLSTGCMRFPPVGVAYGLPSFNILSHVAVESKYSYYTYVTVIAISTCTCTCRYISVPYIHVRVTQF